MLLASRQNFSAIRPRLHAARRSCVPSRCRGLFAGNGTHVQPRIRKRISSTGIGTPRSQRRIHPSFPDCAACLLRYLMSLNRLKRQQRAYSQSELRAKLVAEQVAALCLLKRRGHCAPLLALGRLPVIVGRRIGGGGKEKHLVGSVRLHPAMPKEDNSLCSAHRAIRCGT